MDAFEASVERLDRLRFPGELSFDRSGKTLVATITPAGREARQSYQSRIWRFDLDGSGTQLTDGPGADAMPHYSPVDDRLVFASDRALTGKMALFILDGGRIEPIGDIPGTVESVRWTADGSALIAMAADRGLDGGATNGAKRLTWGAEEDPAIDRPDGAYRRLFWVDPKTGATTEIGPAGLSVWEFDLLGDDEAVALVSDDPSERGWYHQRLVRFGFTARQPLTLHQSRWQFQSLSASPNGERVAFLEGWSSDRGVVASQIRVLELTSGKVSTIDAPAASDVTTFEWRDDESLWFAGWSKIGTIYGLVRSDGTVLWSTYEDAIIGTNSFSASITLAPDKTGFVAVRETAGEPPEIVFKAAPDAEWRPVTEINASVARDFNAYPEVVPFRWQGVGGLELEALLLLPRDRKPGPLPTIVDIHGGPSWAAKYAFNPGYALPLAAAGYAVFLPNYRGNTGWGQDFARLNVGDPAGAEFEDILLGIDRCVADGYADPDRLGVTGASYGGYMTAWAVATTDRFKAAAMVSGIANQLSSHFSCNHHFHEFINGGSLLEEKYRAVALDRSPLIRLNKPTTPTLIIHGAEDRCTPLGQAQEFYYALLDRRVPVELVVYPREGHGLQETTHKRDARKRTVAWFDRYLRPER